MDWRQHDDESPLPFPIGGVYAVREDGRSELGDQLLGMLDGMQEGLNALVDIIEEDERERLEGSLRFPAYDDDELPPAA